MSEPRPIDPERFQQSLAKAGLSQSELARRVGVKQPSIARLASGDQFGTKHLHLIARELGTTPAYLTGETDDPSAGALPMPTPELVAQQLDLVPVAEVDVAFGLGGTYLDTHTATESIIHFPRGWLSQFTGADPAHLRFARGDGDSMEPTIGDGDIILIDLTQNRIVRQDRIWAIAFGDIGMVKRVRGMPDGSYKLMSDNKTVSDEIAVDGEMHVFGRVVATIRSL